MKWSEEEAFAFFEDLCDSLEAMPERYLVLRWMVDEWKAYAGEKFGSVSKRQEQGHDENMDLHGFGRDSFFIRQITNYWDRAALYGVSSQAPMASAGRQAAMKTLTTLVDGLACMVRVHGLPPEPGHPSGELKEWHVHQ